MSLYARLSSEGEVATYPFYLRDLARENISLSANPSIDTLLALQVVPVANTEKPDDTATTNFVEANPALVAGTWAQVWTEVPATAQEVSDRAREATDAAAKAAVKGDTFVTSFIAMTPAEVSTYITNNGTTVATLRTIVIKLAIMVLLLARREYR